MSECLSLDLHIDVANPEEGLRQLLSAIKPDWDQSNLEKKILSGGYSCTLFRCFPKTNPQDSVTVRIATRNVHAIKFQPDWEKNVVKEVAKHGFYPPVYATFKNGYCFEYIHGEPICVKGSPELRLDENLIKLIATQLANVHSVVLPEVDHSSATYFSFIENSVKKDYSSWIENLPSQEELLEELKFIEEICGELQSPIVLCHGDTQPGNIIKKQDKNEVVFIDWEVANIGPRGADLAYSVHVHDYIATFFKIPIRIPKHEEHENLYCKYYLERVNELNGKPRNDLKDEDITQILKEIKTFRLAMSFKIMSACLLHAGTGKAIGMDEKELNSYVIEKHLKAKEELVGFRCWGKKK